MGFGINKFKLVGLKGQEEITKILEQTQLAFELSRKLAPSNISEYTYLLEEIAEARPSLAGDLIFDHVTFYLEDLETSENTKKLIDDIEVSRYIQILNDYTIQKKGVKSVTFDYVYINVNVNSKVNKQSILGLNGTQKTYLGLDDYVIEFTGKTIGSNKLVYDVDTLKKFDALLKLSINKGLPLKVSSIYLNRIWEIYEVVVESYTQNQSSELGQGNMTDFTISAISNKNIPVIQGSTIKI